MTLSDHLRLVWPSRAFIMRGETVDFDDGLPPPTQEELDATHAEALSLWEAEQRRNNAYVWPSRAEFWEEFEQSEKIAILASESMTVKSLLVELQMWHGEVVASDPRIQNGLAFLVSLNIITETRANEITHAA